MALTVIKSTSTDFTGNSISISSQYNGYIPPIVLNDISGYFDGAKAVFPLTLDTTSINTIIDSKDVTVTVNGLVLSPYVAELRYPWIIDYDSNKGFRVKDGNIVIYNAPDSGDSCTVIITNSSQSKQTRRYPYSAMSIALGD
jgi:hypothetical protein